jgi:two-component system, response regulator YesN
MRVLIVEDEPLQRRALAQVLSGLLPQGAVEAARDGIEALQVSRATPPDVVFLDIRMPRLDGLKTAAELGVLVPHAVLFIITAHEDFAYARQALALGVEQYLLKPVGANDLRRCLEIAQERIRARRAQAAREQELRDALADAMPTIRTQFARDLCLGTITSVEEYSRRAALLDLRVEPTLAVSIGLRPRQGGSAQPLRPPISEVEMEITRRDITRELEDLSGRLHPPGIVGRMAHDEIVLLLAQGFARGSLRRMVAGILEVVANAGLECAVGIGRQTGGALSLWRSYQSAVRARQRAWLLGAVPQRVLGADDLGEEEPGEFGQEYPLLAERGLSESVRLGQAEEARAYLSQLTTFYADSLAGAERRSRLIESLALLARAAGEGGAPPQDLLDASARCMEEALQASTPEAMVDTLGRAVDTFLAAVTRAQSARQSGLSARAAAYLEGRFPEQISLTDLAEELHVSPFYLSHVFRQSIGLSFSEYLTRVRINEAKRLLTATGLPVGEIAARVGYREANYFGRVFKKATGLTPLAWRKAH